MCNTLYFIQFFSIMLNTNDFICKTLEIIKKDSIKTDRDVELLPWYYWSVKSNKTSCSVHFPRALCVQNDFWFCTHFIFLCNFGGKTKYLQDFIAENKNAHNAHACTQHQKTWLCARMCIGHTMQSCMSNTFVQVHTKNARKHKKYGGGKADWVWNSTFLPDPPNLECLMTINPKCFLIIGSDILPSPSVRLSSRSASHKLYKCHLPTYLPTYTV